MAAHRRPRKPESTFIRGVCIVEGCDHLQASRGGGRWRSVCMSHHKKPHMEAKAAVCECCGFVPAHPCQLDVDHKDGDHSNNEPDNLITLCANCHRLKTHNEREYMNLPYRS